MSSSLVSAQNRVESPFIKVTIGEYSFGHCTKSADASRMSVTFPNYMESLNINKINGTVNTYTINMVYAITEANDPNLLERVFGSIANSRIITISYGDWNAPAFIYKEEKAIITKIATNIDFNNSRIKYTLTCTSTALALKAGTFTFNPRFAKPSTVLFELLEDQERGLTDIFTGMKNISEVRFKNLIQTDDKEVQIERKESMNIMDYINYLVSCMVSVNDKGTGIKDSNYYWAVYDDTNNEMGGPYFKVLRVDAKVKHNISYNTYEVDVGYPSGNYITSFSLNNNESWSILYEHSADIELPQYSYTIDNEGKIVETYSPNITTSEAYKRTTESSRSWWTKMTQFPITAKMTIKGLLRPALLMSYVKVNAYFYGHKHVSSGLYIITKQEDVIDSSGYKTTLSLTRISGDESYA